MPWIAEKDRSITISEDLLPFRDACPSPKETSQFFRLGESPTWWWTGFAERAQRLRDKPKSTDKSVQPIVIYYYNNPSTDSPSFDESELEILLEMVSSGWSSRNYPAN